MKDKIYLVMNQEGVVKMTRTPPSMDPGERSFPISIDITNKIFKVQQFEGKMCVTDEDLKIVDKLEFELKLLKKKG